MTDFNASFLSKAALASLPFASCGNNVNIDASVRIIGVENLRLGDNVRIDAGTIIIASGPVTIGSRVHVAANCYLEGRGGIRIGDYANVSSYVSLHSVSDDASGRSMTNPMVPERFKRLTIGTITLGRHSVLFTKSTVLPGVTIGEGGVAGAHSLVTRSIPAWTIHAGVPARYIKDRDCSLLLLQQALDVEGNL